MSHPRATILALVVALSLTGCGKTYWTNYPEPFVNQQFLRDRYECNRDAAMLPKTQQSMTRGVGGSIIYADPTLGWADVAASRGMFRACMESKGYRQVSGDEADEIRRLRQQQTPRP